ncbi:MAG: hypothetical protein KKC76_00825 [Proteobacteria bacterium]|nr:hypothetical protein [Pseudomonadota bacterium]MBU4297077.1 hypothetical protein [Pseudomonadota bacterium]MCG2749958.1 hypothetical protein [Desulfobulbaceae bacterium]
MAPLLLQRSIIPATSATRPDNNADHMHAKTLIAEQQVADAEHADFFL